MQEQLPCDLKIADNLESKRLELLQRDDWQQTRPQKRPKYTFETFNDKQLVGRRRKLTTADLEKHAMRRRPSTHVTARELVGSAYSNRRRKPSPNMDDVSIRLGSHIHGSQQTFTQQGSAARAGEAVLVRPEGSLHVAYPGITRNWARLHPSADTRNFESEKTSAKDEDREMLDTTNSDHWTTFDQLTPIACSDSNPSPGQRFRHEEFHKGVSIESCLDPEKDAKPRSTYSKGEASQYFQSYPRLVMQIDAQQRLSEEEVTEYIKPDVSFRSSPPPLIYPLSPNERFTTMTATKRHLSRSVQVNSSGCSEISVNSSENRAWRDYLEVSGSTIAMADVHSRPRSDRDEVHGESLTQQLTQGDF